ncbi:MAG TPA: ATP-binding protein [Synergistales bacterium]|nr:ATP-binding protein [Synergistales bacterium]HRS48235.1 ATP-binding protein [Thermovirgaceae bacterium]HRU90571.1 ATP-binding protein [Thermovirgaceae bacterium]
MERAIPPGISHRITAGIGKAVCTFGMIGPGDHITVGLSGGKDSALLLLGLAWLRERSPVKYILRATMVDITDGECDTSPMSRLCKSLDIPFEVLPCRVLEIIRDRNEKAPCSLCSKMRAGALFARAVENGCTAVAFGHNLDDAVETALLNLFYTGRFSCFHPRSWRDRTGLWLIRPLVFLSESEIAAEARRLGLELIAPLCPFPRDSKRAQIKNLVRTLEGEIPDIRSQVLHALMSSREENNWAGLVKGTGSCYRSASPSRSSQRQQQRLSCPPF